VSGQGGADHLGVVGIGMANHHPINLRVTDQIGPVPSGGGTVAVGKGLSPVGLATRHRHQLSPAIGQQGLSPQISRKAGTNQAQGEGPAGGGRGSRGEGEQGRGDQSYE
jgi:hypothetical protein